MSHVSVSAWEKGKEPVKWGWEKEAGIIIFHIVNVHTRVAQFEGIAGEKNHNAPYESTSVCRV